jgi:hypothetical protein
MRFSFAFFILATLACGGKSKSPTIDGPNAPEVDSGTEQLPGSTCVVAGREYVSGLPVPVDCNSCLCVDGELTNCSTRICSSPVVRCTTSLQGCPVGDICIAQACGEDGVCVPDVECPALGAPACDCNGQTYESACLAARVGLAVAHAGACEERACVVDGQSRPNSSLWQAPDGCNVCSCADGTVICSSRSCVQCGGALESPCASDEYCSFPDLGCGSQSTGYCRLRPQGSCQIEASSVCGCDGNRYDNYCYAAAAGTSVEECSGTP